MIKHSCPTVGANEVRAVSRILRSGEIGGGREVERFEAEMARYIGVSGACAVNSGTAALHLALLALGAGRGREVVLPSYVCSAVLNAVNYTGARPVLADVEPDTGNIEVSQLRRLVTRRTSAIIVAHMFGLPAHIEDALAIGVPVIEDCAMAIGAEHRVERVTRKVGAWGTLGVMSFYATKVLATGQGGMVVGNDRRLMARIRDLVNYDNRKDYKVRYNYPMSALQAAMGREQLARLDGFVQKRRSIAERYEWTLGGLPVLLPSEARNAGEHIYFRYVLRLLKGSDRFIRHAQGRGVEVKRPVFRPLHRYLDLPARRFAGTENVFRAAVSIPLYPSLNDGAVRRIGAVVRGFFDRQVV